MIIANHLMSAVVYRSPTDMVCAETTSDVRLALDVVKGAGQGSAIAKQCFDYFPGDDLRDPFCTRRLG
jgi:hypothetical protein